MMVQVSVSRPVGQDALAGVNPYRMHGLSTLPRVDAYISLTCG